MTEMAHRYETGLLDTCVVIDADEVDEAELPAQSLISTVTLAELGLGIAMASTPEKLALRSEVMIAAETGFKVLPFSREASRRFATMAKLVVAAGRSPKPRKMDLMIAAVASSNDLPLFTRNSADFKGLESVLTVVPV